MVSGPSWLGLFCTPMPARSTLNCPFGSQLQDPVVVVKDGRLLRLNVVNGAADATEDEAPGLLVSIGLGTSSLSPSVDTGPGDC